MIGVLSSLLFIVVIAFVVFCFICGGSKYKEYRSTDYDGSNNDSHGPIHDHRIPRHRKNRLSSKVNDWVRRGLQAPYRLPRPKPSKVRSDLDEKSTRDFSWPEPSPDYPEYDKQHPVVLQPMYDNKVFPGHIPAPDYPLDNEHINTDTPAQNIELIPDTMSSNYLFRQFGSSNTIDRSSIV